MGNAGGKAAVDSHGFLSALKEHPAGSAGTNPLIVSRRGARALPAAPSDFESGEGRALGRKTGFLSAGLREHPAGCAGERHRFRNPPALHATFIAPLLPPPAFREGGASYDACVQRRQVSCQPARR